LLASQAAEGNQRSSSEMVLGGDAATALPLRASELELVDPKLLELLDANSGDGPITVLVSVGLDRATAVAKSKQRSAKQRSATEPIGDPSFEEILDETRLSKARLKSVGVAVTRDLENTDLVVAQISNRNDLAKLLRSGEVARVSADTEHTRMVDQSIGVIRKSAPPASSYDGAGTYVGVIDTGVDYTQPAFGSCPAPGGSCAVSHVFEATTNDGLLDDATQHGTNVSGIVVAVAPAAKIIGIDVFNGNTARSTDIATAINYLIGLRKSGVNVVALNLSLGSASPSGGGDCPFDDFYGIGAAIAAGISPVAAAGNAASSVAVSRPSCIPGVVSVGATYDSNLGGRAWSNCTDTTTAVDKITCFSNSSPRLDMLAPGSSIFAAGATKSGTSQASPHAAGAIALLAQKEPNISVAMRRYRLRATGVPIADPRNGLTRPRLDLPLLLDGANAVLPTPPNDARANALPVPLPGSGSGPNEAATLEPGEVSAGGRTLWWTVTSPTTQNVVVDSCGSNFDTVLTVFNGSSSVGSNDDADCGLASKLTVSMQANVPYHLRIDSATPASSGRAIVRVTPTNYTGIQTITPSRLLETRPGQTTIDGQSQGTGPVSAGSTYTLQVTGRAGISAGALAVTFNITSVTPLGDGWITAYPCDQARPANVSALNYTTGSVVGNLATVKLSASGQVCLYSVATTDMVVDVTGFVPPGGQFQAIAPARYLETRAGQPTFDGQAQGGGSIAAGTTLTLQVSGRGGVPTGASSATFNMTAITPSGPGWVTAYPCDQTRPLASSLNYAGSDVRGNLATIKLSPAGQVCLYSEATTHLVVDITGYQPGTTSSTAILPLRMAETRSGLSTFDGQANGIGMFPARATLFLTIGGRGGIPVGARAVTMNITAIPSTAGGWITAYSCDQPRPLASSLNYGAFQITGNLAHIKLSPEGTVCLYAETATHLVVDVTGYDN
jgi:hypothetical protein